MGGGLPRCPVITTPTIGPLGPLLRFARLACRRFFDIGAGSLRRAQVPVNLGHYGLAMLARVAGDVPHRRGE